MMTINFLGLLNIKPMIVSAVHSFLQTLFEIERPGPIILTVIPKFWGSIPTDNGHWHSPPWVRHTKGTFTVMLHTHYSDSHSI